MKKYIAPLVQITALIEEENLLGLSDPNKNVKAVTSDGTTIDVMPSDKGTGGTTEPPTSGGNLNYSKKFDAWSAWDE